MIRAYVHHNYPVSPDSITVSIVMHPPEGSFDVRPRILRLGGDAFRVAWDEIPPDGEIVEPTLRLDDSSGRALLDALGRHYEGAEDTRALRRDYDAERKRNDKLTDAIIGIAQELAAPGGAA
jgi:hypothetical protein